MLRDEWENWSTQWKKNISQLQKNLLDINLDEGVSLSSKLRKTKQPFKKKKKKFFFFLREWATHAHSHMHIYTHYCSSVVGYSEGIGREGEGALHIK